MHGINGGGTFFKVGALVLVKKTIKNVCSLNWQQWLHKCCNLSGGVALNVWFTTNGVLEEQHHTYMWREQAKIEWSWHVNSIVAYCHSTTLCTGFPIATQALKYGVIAYTPYDGINYTVVDKIKPQWKRIDEPPEIQIGCYRGDPGQQRYSGSSYYLFWPNSTIAMPFDGCITEISICLSSGWIYCRSVVVTQHQIRS